MAKKKFEMEVWYNIDEYGKAWTTVEADSEEEARAILMKAFDDGEEYEFEWEYEAKRAWTYLETEVQCIERKEPGNE